MLPGFTSFTALKCKVGDVSQRMRQTDWICIQSSELGRAGIAALRIADPALCPVPARIFKRKLKRVGHQIRGVSAWSRMPRHTRSACTVSNTSWTRTICAPCSTAFMAKAMLPPRR